MKDEIIQMYKKGWNIEDIADELGISETNVLEILEKLGDLYG